LHVQLKSEIVAFKKHVNLN